MSTFHPFPCLPLELRIQIWESALVQDRVVRVRVKRYHYPVLLPYLRDYWSSTKPPAVTRACQESRRYCNYRKAFIVDESPRYVWVNMDNDIVQMISSEMYELVEGKRAETDTIRHLRLELIGAYELDESENFFYYYSHVICNLSKLERCDVLVDDLRDWTGLLRETYWGALCPKRNVRLIDKEKGEWIDGVSSLAYDDYFDSGGGEKREILVYEGEGEEWEWERRYEAMMKVMPLPRIELEDLRR